MSANLLLNCRGLVLAPTPVTASAPSAYRARILALQERVRCRLAGWKNVVKYEDEAMQLALIFGKIIVNKKGSMKARLP